MARITQSLFEEIEKITSGQIEEKKKVDHDKDGDNDFADVMMARMKAGGKSHKEAHSATRKHNEEVEQEEAEELDETSDPKDKTNEGVLGAVAGGIIGAKAGGVGGALAGGYLGHKVQQAANKKKPMQPATQNEAWPGTKEYKEKFPKDEFAAHMQKYGGDPQAPRAKKGRYGYEGASGSETPETAADSSKVGRGRKKMKEETIVKHEDFSIEITDNPTFKDFLDAAKSYVSEDQAVAVAETFFKEEDTSLVIESQARAMFESVLDSHRKEDVEVTDMEITMEDNHIAVCYTVTESEVIRHYIHQGKIIKGEE